MAKSSGGEALGRGGGGLVFSCPRLQSPPPLPAAAAAAARPGPPARPPPAHWPETPRRRAGRAGRACGADPRRAAGASAPAAPAASGSAGGPAAEPLGDLAFPARPGPRGRPPCAPRRCGCLTRGLPVHPHFQAGQLGLQAATAFARTAKLGLWGKKRQPGRELRLEPDAARHGGWDGRKRRGG